MPLIMTFHCSIVRFPQAVVVIGIARWWGSIASFPFSWESQAWG